MVKVVKAEKNREQMYRPQSIGVTGTQVGQ